MKKLFILSLTLLTTLVASAQLNGNGYYRVKNNSTGNYIWVCDNTGEINTTTTSADMGAIQLRNGLDKAIPEPESVLYFENKGGDYWNISAMGTSIYDLVQHNVELTGVTKNGVTLYEVSASQSGVTLYLFDGGEGPADYNVLATNGKEQAKRKWRIEPISTSGDNYFGIKPTITIGSKYYEPFYAAFPFSFASSGMKAYYISLIDGNIAVLKEIQSEIIPAKTPVIIECSSNSASNNRLNLLTSGGTPVTDNKLTGVFFCNEHRTASADASTLFNANTMRVWNKGSNGKLTLNTDNSTLHKSYYYKKDGKIYLNATSSYLAVSEGTATEFTIMTEEEYANREIFATGISLNKTSASLHVDETVQLTAKVTPDNTTNKNVTWKSSDTKIATVENGVVKAIALGTTTITATTKDGTNLSASCTITVEPVLAQYISLNQTVVIAKEGTEVQLEATIQPENVTNSNVTWSTDNDKVATVSQNGLVKILSVGTATITVTTCDGTNLSAQCVITGELIPAETLTLNETSITISDLEPTFQLAATITPSNVTYKSVEWSSSDKDVVVVNNNGLVSYVGPGEATITAKTLDGSNIEATCAVNSFSGIMSIESDLTNARYFTTSGQPLTQPKRGVNIVVLPNGTTKKIIVE